MGGGVQMQGHAGGIGACMALVPPGALDKVDGLGSAHDRRRPGHPQQRAVGVPDGHDAITVDGSPAQDVVEQGEDLGERVGRSVGLDLRSIHPDRGQVPVWVYAAGAGAHPRVGDDAANATASVPGGEEGVAVTGQPTAARSQCGHRHSETQDGRCRQQGGTPMRRAAGSDLWSDPTARRPSRRLPAIPVRSQ